jgi:hypothetical protein
MPMPSPRMKETVYLPFTGSFAKADVGAEVRGMEAMLRTRMAGTRSAMRGAEDRRAGTSMMDEE